MLNDLENLYDGHQLWCHVSAGAAVSKNMDGSGPRGSFFSTVDAGVSQEIKKKNPPLNLHILHRPELKLVISLE